MSDITLCNIRDGPSIRRILIRRILRETIQLIRNGKSPELKILFDHKLEQDIVLQSVSSYVELCGLLGHGLVSLEWGIIKGDRFVSKKEMKERAKILSEIKRSLK